MSFAQLTKLLLGHIEVGQWLLTEDIGFDINNNYSRRAIEGVENKNKKIIHQRILFYKKHISWLINWLPRQLNCII